MRIDNHESIPPGAQLPPQNYTSEENSQCEHYLAQRNIQPILDSTRLFWLIFCKTFQSLSQQSPNMYEWKFSEGKFTEQYKGTGAVTERTYSIYSRVDAIREALKNHFSR